MLGRRLTQAEVSAAIAAKPGDKVTKAQIEARIRNVSFEQFHGTVTLCSIMLDNGFSVRGETACVDPLNYDAEIGEHLSYERAFAALWPLFGFVLAEARFQLSQVQTAQTALQAFGGEPTPEVPPP